MDIFTFHNPVAPTLMQSGEIINGISSKMWVERYAKAGEFTLVAPVSSGLKSKLPIGSFISHVDTDEIMIVEDHQISDDKDEDSKITVTGRGFETYLEQRISGSNRSFPMILAEGTTTPKFHVPANKSWLQIVYLIDQHINPTAVLDPGNGLPYVTVDTSLSGAGVEADRKVDIDDIYSLVLELLAVDNLGIKIVRPGFWSPVGVAPNTALLIHRGVDRRADVIFSYDTGQLISADYLWSNKKLKNTAIVTTKWMETAVNLGPVNYARRQMHVQASDIDEDYDFTLAVFNFAAINAEMIKRGTAALASQKDLALTKAEVSKHDVDTEYRTHYNVGDLVSVVGSYNESAVMRVTEFVEIEDENGTVAYPTLSLE